jgi:hypothetical protein
MYKPSITSPASSGFVSAATSAPSVKPSPSVSKSYGSVWVGHVLVVVESPSPSESRSAKS